MRHGKPSRQTRLHATDGAQALGQGDRAELQSLDIGIEDAPLTALEGGEELQAVLLQDGRTLRRTALFFAADEPPACDLAAQLGCRFTRKGSVVTSPYEKTDVDGLFVAGDASRHVHLAIVAAAEGAMAAFAINAELLDDDRKAIYSHGRGETLSQREA